MASFAPVDSMRDSILSLAFACLLAPAAASQASIPELRVGQTHSGSIGADDPRLLQDSPTQRLALSSKAGGKVTISVNSIDFDAFLRVETEAGDVVAEADDGGIETNARLVVELGRDKRYQVLVAAKGGGSGWFWVDCQAGERPAPSREAIRIAAVAYHGSAANAELAKGEEHRPAAAAHLERKGAILLEQGKFAEAGQAFESARSLWEESKDGKNAIQATLELGRVASALKDWKGAEARFSEALAAYRALPDPAGEARTLVAQADARAAAGDPAAATSLYQEALALAEKHADAESATLAMAGIAALNHAPADREAKRETAEKLGNLWRAGGDLEKAREQHRKEVELARESKDRIAEGSALSNLGQDWLQALDLAHARECFEGALRIAAETGDQLARVGALEGLGQVWFKLQDYPKALHFHEQQLELAGSDPEKARRANLGIAKCCQALHDYPRARACFESELKQARCSGDPLGESQALEYVASVEMQTGNVMKGLELRSQAAELRKGSDGDDVLAAVWKAVGLMEAGEVTRAQAMFEDCLERARVVGNLPARLEACLRLGLCHEHRGRYADAIGCFSEMIDVARTLGRRLDEETGLELRGAQYLAIGGLEKALADSEESLAIAREAADPISELQALNGVGNVWFELQQTDKARECYSKVEALGAKMGFPIVQPHALNNRGLTYWKTGNYQESRPLLEQAVQSAAELQAPAQLAEFQGNLARVLVKLGDREGARKLATESLAVLGSTDASEPRKMLIPLEALVPLAIAGGDRAGAKSLLERADAVLEEIRIEAQAAPGDVGADPWILFPHFDPFRQDLVRQTELQGGLGPDEHEKLLERGFRDADRARARHLASGIVGHRRGTRSKDTLQLRDEWKQALGQVSDAQREASRAIRAGKPAEEVDRLQLEVLARRYEAENLGEALREVSPGDAALDIPEGVDPSALRGTIVTKGCALIEYADGDESLYAYVLTEKGLALLELGKRKAVDAARRTLPRAARRAEGSREPERDCAGRPRGLRSPPRDPARGGGHGHRAPPVVPDPVPRRAALRRARRLRQARREGLR
jgi:tetratricopeptide (TPR) repeat protein